MLVTINNKEITAENLSEQIEDPSNSTVWRGENRTRNASGLISKATWSNETGVLYRNNKIKASAACVFRCSAPRVTFVTPAYKRKWLKMLVVDETISIWLDMAREGILGYFIKRASCNITIEFMFAGINMFWARLRLILARAARRGLKWVWEGPKTYLCPRT